MFFSRSLLFSGDCLLKRKYYKRTVFSLYKFLILTKLTDSLLFHLTQKSFNCFVHETSGRTETVSRASIREQSETRRCRILHSDCRQIRPYVWWQYSPEWHRSVQVVGSKLVVIVSLEVSLVVDDCISPDID